MSEIIKIRELGKSIRRVLFLQQVLMFNLDDLKDLSNCPALLKPEIGGAKRSMISLKNKMLANGNAEMSAIINGHLSSEGMHDLNMILEQLMGIDNLSEVSEWLGELIDKAEKTQAA